MPTLVWVGLGVVAINLPFGYWREGLRKLSPLWFVAIHAPVPVVAWMRIESGLGWSWKTFPVLVGCYFLGQVAGSRFRRRLNRGG